MEIAMDCLANGWPDKARRFARRALAIFEEEPTTGRASVVRALLCLAGARVDLGDYLRAEADYQHADVILGPIADDTNDCDLQRLRTQTTRGLASVARELGRHSEAETLLRHALEMAEGAFGCEHAEVAAVLNDFGVHYRETSRYEKASTLHRRALSMTEKTLGADDVQAAIILHDLGFSNTRAVSLRQAKCSPGGRSRFERRRSDRTTRLSPPTSFPLRRFSRDRRSYDEAESMYRRALTMLGRWFGPDHPDVAATAHHLARVFDRSRRAADEDTTGGVRCA
jgi:tetratricopeptide (TPR) repeat protein